MKLVSNSNIYRHININLYIFYFFKKKRKKIYFIHIYACSGLEFLPICTILRF